MISPNGIEVPGPKCPVDPPRSGLLSAVQPLQGIDGHWQNGGIWWEDFLCSPSVTGFTDTCVPEDRFHKPFEGNIKFCQADPFVLIGSYKCPPVGRPADQAFEIARQRLLKWEGFQLEKTLWTGEVANGSGLINPSFAYGNAECGIIPIDLHPAGAVSPVGAISLMEEALRDSVGTCGIMHAPYTLAAYLHSLYVLELQGENYSTPTGYQIIFGNGYPGSGPANVPAVAGECWIFGTGPLILARSNMMQIPENIQEGFNRMVNDVELRAERYYSIGFSCALFAVRVNLSTIGA